MLVYFEGDLCSLSVHFEPIVHYNVEAIDIFGVELLSRVVKSDGSFIPPFYFFSKIHRDLKFEIFKNQIIHVKDNALWLTEKNIIASVNIDFDVAEMIIESEPVQALICSIKKCFALEITEDFWCNIRCMNFSKEKKDSFLFNLFPFCSLWLDDFGTSYANLDMIDVGFFSAIKISGNITNSLLSDRESTYFFKAICRHIKKSGCQCIVEGIENYPRYLNARNSYISGYQGYHWQGGGDLIKLIEKYQIKDNHLLNK